MRPRAPRIIQSTPIAFAVKKIYSRLGARSLSSYRAPSLYLPTATHSVCLLSIHWWLVDVSRFMIRSPSPSSMRFLSVSHAPHETSFTVSTSPSLSLSLLVPREERNFTTTMARGNMRELCSLRWIDSMFLLAQVIHLSCPRPGAIDAVYVRRYRLTLLSLLQLLDRRAHATYCSATCALALVLSAFHSRC